MGKGGMQQWQHHSPAQATNRTNLGFVCRINSLPPPLQAEASAKNREVEPEWSGAAPPPPPQQPHLPMGAPPWEQQTPETGCRAPVHSGAGEGGRGPMLGRGDLPASLESGCAQELMCSGRCDLGMAAAHPLEARWAGCQGQSASGWHGPAAWEQAVAQLGLAGGGEHQRRPLSPGPVPPPSSPLPASLSSTPPPQGVLHSGAGMLFLWALGGGGGERPSVVILGTS